jgi:hypothetical protein
MLAAPVDLKDPGAMGCSAGSLLSAFGLETSDFRSFDQAGIDNGRLDIQEPSFQASTPPFSAFTEV